MKILVVDDDPEITNLLATILIDAGHEVASVESGSAALQASIMSEYDLLICDLMLPDLQGTEIVRALKAQSPHLPVMVISALDAHTWEKPCEDAGATRYLQKPLSIKTLRHEVELVQRARLQLSIAIVDTDPIHAIHLEKALIALGCEVSRYDSAAAAQQGIESGDQAGLLVADAGQPGAENLIRWAKQRDTPAFAFSSEFSDNTEERLMRAGAAFLMSKPVNTDALLTQAAFMVAM